MSQQITKNNTKTAWIECIYGSMYSGKTETLIDKIHENIDNNNTVLVFKPKIDNRYHTDFIVSHNKRKVRAIVIEQSIEILTHIKPTTTLIAIDEIQFFDKEIIDLIIKLKESGINIICAGLDTDFRGFPFFVTFYIRAMAKYTKRLFAECSLCSEKATHSQRIVQGNPAYYNEPIVKVGAQESYLARCEKHHYVPGLENRGEKIMNIIDLQILGALGHTEGLILEYLRNMEESKISITTISEDISLHPSEISNILEKLNRKELIKLPEKWFEAGFDSILPYTIEHQLVYEYVSLWKANGKPYAGSKIASRTNFKLAWYKKLTQGA